MPAGSSARNLRVASCSAAAGRVAQGNEASAGRAPRRLASGRVVEAGRQPFRGRNPRRPIDSPLCPLRRLPRVPWSPGRPCDGILVVSAEPGRNVRGSGRRSGQGEQSQEVDLAAVLGPVTELASTLAPEVAVSSQVSPKPDPPPEPELELPRYKEALRRVINKHTVLGVILGVTAAAFVGALRLLSSKLQSETATKCFLVALGAVIGALMRWVLQMSFNSLWPHGTLMANLIGCFLAGCLSPFFHIWPPGSRLLLLSGFLGALTTLSSFSLETVLLLQKQRTAMAVQYLFTTVAGSLVTCSLGATIGSWLLMR